MELVHLIDIAVLCQEYSSVDVSCENSHTTILDEIEIYKKDFLTLFYPYGENFGINKNIINDVRYNKYLSFESEYRTINGKKFFLLEQILQNLELDLNLSRNCFTNHSRIELANEFSSIKSLCDMNCCSVVASLPWSNIETILNNYKISDKYMEPIFAISICFKTPTPNVKDTIIKFHYKITI
jgi:hypothetical protein